MYHLTEDKRPWQQCTKIIAHIYKCKAFVRVQKISFSPGSQMLAEWLDLLVQYRDATCRLS